MSIIVLKGIYSCIALPAKTIKNKEIRQYFHIIPLQACLNTASGLYVYFSWVTGVPRRSVEVIGGVFNNYY